MVPKIGDFGLSRLVDSMQTYITQTQSTLGTRGYMTPEYIDEHQISPKFDIFILGAIMIRIMARNVAYSNYTTMSSRQFVELVQENWKKRSQEAMSPSASEEVKTCIEIALRCVETNRNTKRPTITEIVDELSKIDTPRSSPIAQGQCRSSKTKRPEMGFSVRADGVMLSYLSVVQGGHCTKCQGKKNRSRRPRSRRHG